MSEQLKQHTHCLNCGFPVDKKEAKPWRWAGWVASGPAPSAPMPSGNGPDQWDFVFHKQCFGEWLENRNGFLQDLDRPMNNCVYFQRTGSSSHGYYVRDGKKHAVFAGWIEADISGASLFTPMPGGVFTEQGDDKLHTPSRTWHEMKLDFPYIKIIVADPNQWLADFRAFLQKNGWMNEGWYEPRKPFVEKTAVRDAMTAKYGAK